MITTQDFSNFPTINNEGEDIKRNSLTKEDDFIKSNESLSKYVTILETQESFL